MVGAYLVRGWTRWILPGIGLLLALVASFVAVRVDAWWFLLAALGWGIVALAIYDALQRQSALLANYLVLARLRGLALHLRPFFRSYLVEDDQEGKPYSYESRSLVYRRAAGISSTHPFGTQLDTYREGFNWITHSMAPVNRPAEKPRVLVGAEATEQPYSASVFNISALSFGAISGRAIESLVLGARLGNFYLDTGEGGISRYHRGHGGDLVFEIGSGYFGCRDARGRFDPEAFADQARQDCVRMTEIKLSQGAKPGHGGVLPAAKVSPEVAAARGIPVHRECRSPRAHSAFSTPIELVQFAAEMRRLSGGKPVGVKFCVGQIHEVMAIIKAMLETGIYLDYIVVDGAEGGTGAAPLELTNHVGMPLLDGLIVVRNALVGSALHHQVRLAASGKIHSGTHIAECMAIGADWCNAARAFMFAIGCIQAQRCHTGTCPSGVATQDPARQRRLVPEVQAERVRNFHDATVHALMDIVAAAGLEHPRALRPHHVYHRVSVSKSLPLDRIWEFLPEGALLEEPGKTSYAFWWRAADPESFKPRLDLSVVRNTVPRLASLR